MGKKGSKRKTRWRTLSIGAPPGEEDEEEGLRNGYVRGQENEGGSRTLDRNGQIGYKPRRSYTGTTTSGYTSGGSRSRRDDPPNSPAQPKIIFNEDEYTRITTPRQDVLFKKGYLSRKKPWAASTASTSATPSTTESQSASHSTADGSETNEDQQLLDRDSGGGEYPSIVEPGTQLAYGTFYDHASGYYYEYPVMLVGPPIPGQIGPSVLAAVPCGPVPLRPIEWVNPAFVPKLSGQPYCYMNCQVEPSPEPSTLINAQTPLAAENTNEKENENATGSVSGSDVEEEPNEDITEGPKDDQNQCFLETSMTQQVHVAHVPQIPQQYIYPGHYMFGPSLVNVNGVTIQSGPMVRTNDIVATTTVAACAKRKKKKKKRKQRRLAPGNAEDEEEEEYSSECDNGVTAARPSWTANSATTLNRPLNPECQEFQLRSADELQTSSNADTNDDVAQSVAQEDTVSSQPSLPSSSSTPPAEEEEDEEEEEIHSNEPNGSLSKVPTDSETVINDDSSKLISRSSIEDSSLVSLKEDQSRDPENDARRLADDHVDSEDDVLENEILNDAENKIEVNGSLYEADEDLSPKNGTNDGADLISREYSEEERVNGNTTDDEDVETRSSNGLLSPEVTTTGPTSPSGAAVLEVSEKPSSRPISPVINCTTTSINSETKRLPESYESLVMKPPGVPPRRKYSAKGFKFVREPTPGPDLDSDANVDVEDGPRTRTEDIERDFEVFEANVIDTSSSSSSSSEKRESAFVVNESAMNVIKQMVQGCDNDDNKDIIERCVEDSNEDLGFESQTRLSDHPITSAVTEWLRCANSPTVFLTPTEMLDSETDDEDKQTDEPPKNLQSNPMPALSVNDNADDVALSRIVDRGEFARSSVDDDQAEIIARRKKRSRDTKRRPERRNGAVEGRGVVSWNSREITKDLVIEDVDACEFTEKDSTVGMRVALSSRMISRRGEEEPTDRKVVEVLDGVRTFERGEIVVSISGKLLCGALQHEPILQDRRICEKIGADVIRVGRVVEHDNEEPSKHAETERNDNKGVGDEKDANALAFSNLSSVEEPDVLECWEAETVEPVITSSRKIWQSRGISLEEEATEEDGDEPELNRANKKLVSKYYRLARAYTTSVEEEEEEEEEEVAESSEMKTKTLTSSLKSRTVPNSPERMIENLCSEEIPIIMPIEEKTMSSGKRRMPVEEAFEVYESCYTGKTQRVPVDMKMPRSRSLYGQDGEGPVPCRAVCCNIQ